MKKKNEKLQQKVSRSSSVRDTSDDNATDARTDLDLSTFFGGLEEVRQEKREESLKEHAQRLQEEGKSREEVFRELKDSDREPGSGSDSLEDGRLRELVNSVFPTLPDPDSDDYSRGEFAQRFLEMKSFLGTRYAYVPEQKQFYRYRQGNGIWKPVEKKYIKQSIWQEVEDTTEANAVLKQIVYQVMDEENQNRFDPGKKPDLDHINFENGILDWRSGDLMEHDPERYDLVQIPHEYDSDADCDLWEEKMEEWIPDEDTRKFVQEFMGLCLIPDTSHGRMMFLLGEGMNGKSTFLNVMRAVFGDDNFQGIPFRKLTSQSRFEVLNLRGALVNACTDMDCDEIKNNRVLKNVSVGDSVRGEQKHGKSLDFTPFARMIFSANELPETADNTTAWYRRLEIVEFPNQFDPDDPGTNKNLAEDLMEEIPGIINWQLEGLRRLKSRGHVEPSDQMRKRKLRYKLENKHESKPVEAWYDECVESGDGDDTLPTASLYDQYVSWSRDMGVEPVSDQKFPKRLKDLHGSERKGSYTFEVCADCGEISCDSAACDGEETERTRRRGFSHIRIEDGNG